MDGTGKLLLDFAAALPEEIRREIPNYPKDVILSYEQLANLVRSMCEESPPFVLMAESFSTPLAIRIAAENPPNLRALVLCAGFATSPVRGLKRRLASLLAAALTRLPLPEAVIRSWLVGRDAQSALVNTVRETIASVSPSVLSSRLQAVFACDVRPDLSKIRVPILYLKARHDRLIDQHCLEEIRAILPGLDTEVVDGPHFLLQREPERCARIVSEFLTKLN